MSHSLKAEQEQKSSPSNTPLDPILLVVEVEKSQENHHSCSSCTKSRKPQISYAQLKRLQLKKTGGLLVKKLPLICINLIGIKRTANK